MYLQSCRFECEEENFLDPFEDFVNLKTLYFHNCRCYKGIETLKISTFQLRDLSISSFIVDEKFNLVYKIELCTPKFKYFKYFDSDLYCFSTEIDLFSVKKIYYCLIEDTDSLFHLIELFDIMPTARHVSVI